MISVITFAIAIILSIPTIIRMIDTLVRRYIRPPNNQDILPDLPGVYHEIPEIAISFFFQLLRGRRRVVGEEVNATARAITNERLAEFSDLLTTEEITAMPVNAQIPQQRIPGIVVEMVARAKNRFTLPKRNRANYLSVNAFLLNEMTEHGMRPTHIRAMLPLALELSFTPDENDVFAAQFNASAYVDQAHQAYEHPYIHLGSRSVLDWFGIRRTPKGYPES
jgi:hypothetical protein